MVHHEQRAELLEAVKGQGMPFKGQPFNFGNLFLHLKAGKFSYESIVGNTLPIHTNNCSQIFREDGDFVTGHGSLQEA